jgi:cytochrome P450
MCRRVSVPELLRGGWRRRCAGFRRWRTSLRYTTEDVMLPGVRIPRGEAVVAWLASANRDESEFDGPYRFDVARRPNRHVAYGEGSRYCIGAAAARATLRAAFAHIFQTVRWFEILEPPEHFMSNFTAGIKRLVVQATPALGSNPSVHRRMAWR